MTGVALEATALATVCVALAATGSTLAVRALGARRARARWLGRDEQPMERIHGVFSRVVGVVGASRSAIDGGLPAVLEGVARAVRSGASLAAAIEAAAPEEPARLSHAWAGLAARCHQLGVADGAAAWRQAQASTQGVRLTAAALRVAAAVGGPQARAIDSVASTLRQRLLLDAEVRALTSQARASAVALVVAPLGFALVAASLEPRYLSFLATPLGATAIAAGVALDAAGFLWMARLVRVEGAP